MTKKLPPPITPESFEKIVNQWARIVRFKESGSIYYYSKAGLLRRLDQLFKNKTLLKKFFSNIEIQVVDLEAQVIEDQEDLGFLVLPKEKRRAVFILGSDKVLQEKRADLLDNLASLATFNSQVSLLLFFHQDFTHPDYASLFKARNILLENTIFHSLHRKKDIEQFVEYLEAKWDLKLSQKIKNKIVKECGGNFWFVKQAVRFLRDYPEREGEVFDHEQMKLRLKLTWQGFGRSEKGILEKIVKKQKEFNPDEFHSLDFSKKTGWIKKGKNGWQITIPLLAKFIQRRLERVDLIVDSRGKIFLKGILVDGHFSAKEKRVMSLLISKKGKIVFREEIAKTIWAKGWEDFYSDWAIDQTISRLRKKLSELDISPQVIKTIRGKGFCCLTG